MHPEDAAWALPLFFELLGQPGGVLERRLRFRHRDGHYLQLEMTAYNLLHDPDVGGIVVNSRDISERLREQEQIRYQTSLLEQMTAASNTGMLVVDPGLNYSSWNQRFLELWNLSDEQLRAGRAAVLPAIQGLLADPAAFMEENERLNQDHDALAQDQLRLRDGRVLERYSTPLRAAGGIDYGRVWFFHDITELVQAREAAEDAQQRVAALAALRDRLTHMVVHDLRNPIFGASLMLQMLGDPPDPAALDAEAWATLRRQLDYAGELCQQMLEIKRMESGELVARPAPGDLAATVSSALETIRPQADQKSLRLVCRVPERQLVCDHRLLRRILLNLLHNAVKFSPPGAEISVACRDTAEAIELSVSDAGPGIPAADHERIFELFGMVGSAANPGGTGIGLSFCALAARAMGGSIRVESSPGQGSRFILRLPRD